MCAGNREIFLQNALRADCFSGIFLCSLIPVIERSWRRVPEKQSAPQEAARFGGTLLQLLSTGHNVLH